MKDRPKNNSNRLEQPQKTTRGSLRSVSFLDFWTIVATELGHARLHLDTQASDLNGFILERSDVRTYLHRAIKRTYRESHCQNLNSPIVFECVLDVLGETAFQIQQDKSGDLFDIELLEEIAWLICDRFSDQVTQLVARCQAWTPAPQRNSAKILSFTDHKIRRENLRL